MSKNLWFFCAAIASALFSYVAFAFEHRESAENPNKLKADVWVSDAKALQRIREGDASECHECALPGKN